MTVQDIFGLAPVQLHNTAASAVVLGGIIRSNLSIGSEYTQEATDGEPWSRIANMVAQKSVGTFATRHLTTAIDEFGLFVKVDGQVNSGFTFFQQKQEAGGHRTTGANHRSKALKNGMIVPMRLSADHQGDAEIEYQVFATYDGTNAPIVVAENVTLPAVTSDYERFALDENCDIGGVTVQGVRRLELDFGYEIEQVAADSDRWPGIVRIKQGLPTLSLTGIDPKWLSASAFQITSNLATHANTAIFLRKRQTEVSDGFVLDATTDHIKITAAGSVDVEEGFDANGNELGETSLRVLGTYDATNTPFVLTTGIAIT